MSARTLTALALVFSTAFISALSGCGGTVVYEEDGGQGLAGQGGNGDGGSGNGSTSSNPTNGSNTTVGPTPGSTGPGLTVSASSGVPGCGTLFDDLDGFDPQCESCTESVCCAEVLACTQGTPCWDCILGPSCTEQGSATLRALSECIELSCEDACDGGGDCKEFECFETGECISFQFVCDGGFDCADGSDESPNVCGCGPEDFQCFDGQCIPGDFVCDGEDDCFDGEDEFCQDVGICDTGLFSGDANVDQCLGDFCCAEFEECTDFGQDIGGCVDCFNQGGGQECDFALECSSNSGCSDICGSGIGAINPFINVCLSNSCCDGWFSCLNEGDEDCLECINEGGGEICAEFIECACGACDLCF